MKGLPGRLAIGLAAVVALLPGLGSADHFDGQSATGTFNPKFELTLANNFPGKPADLTLRLSQLDHEDPIALGAIDIPAAWDFPYALIRQGEKPGGGGLTTSCEDTVDGRSNGVLGDAHFARAEKIGNGTLVVRANGLGRPNPPDVVWEADLAFISWNGATSTARLCLMLDSDDERLKSVPLPPNIGPEDLSELVVKFSVQRKTTAAGLVWEIPIDGGDLAKNELIQGVQASLIKLESTTFGRSVGNWHAGGIDVAVNPTAQGTYSFTADFSTCPNVDGNPNTEWHLCSSGRPAVHRVIPIDIYHVTITSPKNGDSVTQNPVAVQGIAEPNLIVKVYEIGDPTPKAQTTSSSSGAWQTSIDVAGGEHEIDASSVKNGVESPRSKSVKFVLSAFPFQYVGSFGGQPACLFVNPVSGLFRFRVPALDTDQGKFAVQDFATVMRFFPGEGPDQGSGVLFHQNRLSQPYPPSWMMLSEFETASAFALFYGDLLAIPFTGTRATCTVA